MLCTKKKIFVFTMIISIFPLINFILLAISLSMHSAASILDEVFSSLNENPLISLDYSTYCYENPISLYYFHGSQAGCSCINIDYYHYEQKGKNEVNPGSCSLNQTRNGCTNINGIQGRNLQYWGNGRFCSRLYTIPQYYSYKYLYPLDNSVSVKIVKKDIKNVEN